MRGRPFLLSCLPVTLLLVAMLAFLAMVHVSRATVINVPQDHPTIQQAIDAASAGDTVQVNRRSGESQSIYYERLLITKELTVAGEGRDTIIIDGGGVGSVMRIQADNVQIEGFTIRNGGQKYSGIRTDDYSYITVFNNTIEANKYGVFLLYSSYNTIVQNELVDNDANGISLLESVGNNVSHNNVSSSAFGIKLVSTNTTFVVDNTVADSSYGIYIDHSTNDTVDKNTLLRNGVDGIFPNACHDLTISNNNVSESAYGLQLYGCTTVTLRGNNATDNSYGIYLAYSGPANTVENNTLVNNDWGITLYGSSSNTFTGNTFALNTFGVDPVTEANSNLFHHNNFVENTEQVVWNPDCINTWDDGYPSGGNYWSDYTGVDANSDGIGDTAYIIDAFNRDRYPLMNPFGPYSDVAVLSVTPSDTEVYIGEIVNVTVTAGNQGTGTETFDVTARYENTTLAIFGTIGIQAVTNLAPGEDVILIFSWNTTDMQPCVSYTIIAEASTVPGETAIADNIYVDGKVKVKQPGDINGDGVVDILDLTFVALCYGAHEGDPRYNPDADLTEDGFIDARDLAIVSVNWGNTCP